MTESKEGSRTQIYGIPLGKKWGPTQPVVDTISTYGISITRGIISYLRDRSYKGRLTTEQLRSIEKLEQDDASDKDKMYLNITTTGVELRKTYLSTIGRYSAAYLLQSIGEEISESANVVRGLLRVMRTDSVSLDQEYKDEGAKDVREHFFKSVDKYIEAYQNPPSLRPKLYDVLKDARDCQNIAEFYRLLYNGSSTWSIAAWTTFEVEALSCFYDHQANIGHPLTPFDRFVLTATIDNKPANDVIKEAQARFPVPVRTNDVRLHRNLLLYGQLRVDRELYQSS